MIKNLIDLIKNLIDLIKNLINFQTAWVLKQKAELMLS